MDFKTPPILFLIFNRPDLSGRVFERIREARPERLFIAADGPRADRPDDARLCKEARGITSQVDWPCKLRTLFRGENLGCKVAVEDAISWFFNEVEAGIILEDDCLPSRSFFPFCSDLLQTHASSDHVAVISGNDLRPDGEASGHSYYFSHYGGCWGWASWRRAWNEYQSELPAREPGDVLNWLEQELGDRSAAAYWQEIFLRVSRHEINSWAYRWLFSQWAKGRVAISPAVNLVSNIGFDERGTHTKSADTKLSRLALGEAGFPLVHAHYEKSLCAANDRKIEAKAYNIPAFEASRVDARLAGGQASTQKPPPAAFSIRSLIKSTIRKAKSGLR